MLRRLLDSPWTYFVAAGLLAAVAVWTQVEIHLPSRPKGDLADLEKLRERDDLNVVFVLIDTLRADHLGCYGYERDTSPILDLMAESGIRFAHVQSQSSWTKASMASLWTGMYPRRTGVQRFGDALSPEATTPAEIFQQAGFRTGGVFRNGWVEANFGFAQGFDLYISPRPSATPARFERYNPSAPGLQGTDLDATQSAREFIRTHAHDRFFLYIHYMDVHQYLYDEESGIFGTHIADVYDNSIHWTDRNLSAVLAELEANDVFDRTLVVIASDHGEAFYEHGIEGHARNLYREVTETPFVVIPPFRLEQGIVVQEPVENVDVWPTVLDLVGLPPLPHTDGQSLVPLIRKAAAGESSEAGDPTYAELDRSWGKQEAEPEPIVAMVDGSYRMVKWLESGRIELYDRSHDPKEQRNIAGRNEGVTEELARKIEPYTDAVAAWEAPQVELDAMRLGQLRALGYALEPKKKKEEEGKETTRQAAATEAAAGGAPDDEGS